MRGKADAAQQNRDGINALEIRLDELSPLLDDEDKVLPAKCSPDYYFIGNSITRHEITYYWWSDYSGMTATSRDAMQIMYIRPRCFSLAD